MISVFIWLLAGGPSLHWFIRYLPDYMYGDLDASGRSGRLLSIVVPVVIAFATAAMVTCICNVTTYRFISRRTTENDSTMTEYRSLTRRRKAMVTASLQFLSTTCLQVYFQADVAGGVG